MSYRLPNIGEVFEVKHRLLKDHTFECIGFNTEDRMRYYQLKVITGDEPGHITGVESLWFDEKQTGRKITWKQAELFPTKHYVSECWDEIK